MLLSKEADRLFGSSALRTSGTRGYVMNIGSKVLAVLAVSALIGAPVLGVAPVAAQTLTCQDIAGSASTKDALSALVKEHPSCAQAIEDRADELGIKYVFDEGTGGGGGGNGGSISGINLTQPLLTDIINPEPPVGCTEGSCS